MSRIYILLGALAVIGTLTGSAYLMGRAEGAQNARNAQLEVIQKLNRQLKIKDEQLEEAEAERLDMVAELQARLNNLSEAAREDPNAARACLSPGSVRRHNALSGN